MRGNHRIWGRQDYTEPAPLPPAALQRVGQVQIRPREGFKTWQEAVLDGELIGYVATRIGGQLWRTSDMEDWQFAASDWNRADPPHGRAILALLEHRGLPCPILAGSTPDNK